MKKTNLKASLVQGVTAVGMGYMAIQNKIYQGLCQEGLADYHWWNGQLSDFGYVAGMTSLGAFFSNLFSAPTKKVTELGLTFAGLWTFYEISQPFIEGNAFDWKDIVAYFAGAGFSVGLNKLLRREKKEEINLETLTAPTSI